MINKLSMKINAYNINADKEKTASYTAFVVPFITVNIFKKLPRRNIGVFYL